MIALVALTLALAQDLPASISEAVRVDDVPLLHTRQVMAFDAAGALADLERLLKRGGSGLDKVVKLNVYAGAPGRVPAIRAAIQEKCPSKPAVSFVCGDLPGPVAMDAVATTDLRDLRRSGDLGLLPGGGRVYLSGQAERGELRGATRKTLDGLRKTLEWLGLADSDIVQIKIFFHPTSRLGDVRREVEAFYGQPLPTVYVEWMMPIPIEIELIAKSPRDDARPALEYLTPPGVAASPVYSRVARINRGPTIFVSGLVADRAGTAEEEVLGAFEKLRGVVEKAGGDLKHLVKATYYVSTDDVSRKLNELRPRFYDPARPPAASKASVRAVGWEGRTLTLDMIAVERER